MPGKRSKDQKLIAFPLDEALLTQVDSARRGKSRSQYIRDALGAYLESDSNIVVREDQIAPPDRVGKGGRPRKINYLDEVKKDKANRRTKIQDATKPKTAKP